MKRVFKIILKILVGLLVFLIIAVGSLFILARCNPELVQRFFEEEPEYITFNQLPNDREAMKADFDGIHQTVVENYSLYRQKGISMDSLYNVYSARLCDSVKTNDDYGMMLLEYFADLHCGHASAFFKGEHYEQFFDQSSEQVARCVQKDDYRLQCEGLSFPVPGRTFRLRSGLRTKPEGIYCLAADGQRQSAGVSFHE